MYYENYTQEKEEEIKRDLAHVINCHSLENGSNTPDFILAEYLYDCLMAYNQTSRKREKWFGRSLSIGSNEPMILVSGPIDCSINECYCEAREDETHCQCWWDGDECCNCSHPAILKSLED